MPEIGRENWRLEGFLDALILELDRAQDTLAVKALSQTRRVTYAVKDLTLDLQVFPSYQDGKVWFVSPRPGESGSSRISLQLGSITDRQIREIGNRPITRDDVAIDEIEELEPELKESLKKLGVTSARDLERMERQNVDIEKVVRDKTGSGIDYGNLANVINKARRRKRGPRVLGMTARRTKPGQVEIELRGHDLMLFEAGAGFPAAALNDEAVDVLDATPDRVVLRADDRRLRRGTNRLEMALDPYAVMSVEIKT
jgi:hypothetical protein